MNRRHFMEKSARTLTAGVGGSLLARGLLKGENPSPRARIGVSTWSLHNLFPSTRDDNAPTPAKPLELLDVPEMIAERYQVHQVEFVAPHFGATSPSYLQDMKTRLARAHSHLTNICVDIDELELGGGLSDPDPKLRDRIVEACSKWIDIAHQLGADSVRCDPGKINSADLSPTVSAYRKLATYGASQRVAVVVENHGGVGSEHPEELVRIFSEVDSKFFGALPDFGNFPNQETRERGLLLLFPYARTVCHAKASRRREQGDDAQFVARCVQLSKQAGFRGIYSIESGGPDPYGAVQHVIDLLTQSISI
ncbi:MAG: TIM barrel protein [Terriglobia bacterium]